MSVIFHTLHVWLKTSAVPLARNVPNAWMVILWRTLINDAQQSRDQLTLVCDCVMHVFLASWSWYIVWFPVGSAEWLRTDARRTAVGLDLDLESLEWCLENNLSKIGADGYSRMLLFHGNVLQPNVARLVKQKICDAMQDLHVNNDNDSLASNICDQLDPASPKCSANSTMSDLVLPARDIICAFNYSCCCLHRRKDLVLYFRHAFNALSKRGGIFVMDVYGGTSSERKLRLQRRFPSFTVSDVVLVISPYTSYESTKCYLLAHQIEMW